jgi:8-oxo-dGTP pyrophosphatase MutT (NUDIX family)
MMLRAAGAGFAVYLTRRSERARFMPGAYVFPGGAVDAADGEPAARNRLFGAVDGIDGAFAIAALRELFEEAGVLIACRHDGSPARIPPDSLRDLRRALVQGRTFAALLSEDDLHLDARELVYYSNWITPLAEPLRFDTHFFIASPPEGQIAEADAVEVHDGVWLEPRAALDEAAHDRLQLMFPTRKHLERLAEFDSLERFLAHARQRAPLVAPIVPEVRDGVPYFTEGEAW